MASAIPASELISNLASAQQSMEAANEAYENWRHEYQNNEASLRAAMERHASLQAEEKKRQQDIKEGQKTVTAANAALAAFYRSAAAPLDSGYASPAELPASPKRLSKKAAAAMSPEQKKAHKAAKKRSTDERRAARLAGIAAGDEKAIAEQAQIEVRVAKMQAALAASRAAKKAIQEVAGDEMPSLVASV